MADTATKPKLKAPPDLEKSFFAPKFEIWLNGQSVNPFVLSEVQEVVYSDDIEQPATFEFTLDDWDPEQLRPKYSSPYDQQGGRYLFRGEPLPLFEPGAELTLKMGYQDDQPLKQMLAGEVVSITPNFPAAGAPVVRIRAANFLTRLQRRKVSGTREDKPLKVAEWIAIKAGVDRVVLPPGPVPGVSKKETLHSVNAFEEILTRARRENLSLRLEKDTQTTLYFDPRTANETAIASLLWGLNLISFAPQLSAARAIEKVIVRNVEPGEKGAKQKFEGIATWDKLDGLMTDALGPEGLANSEAAFKGNFEEIVASDVKDQAEAERRALERLKEIAGNLVKGSGTTIGDPRLRAGTVIEIAGLGPRFSGLYRLTQTTHTIGAAGYVTSFQAAKLVFAR